MPQTKKDLNAKFICPLEQYGCRGIHTDNKWTYKKHCVDCESHKDAILKKDGVKNGVKEQKNGPEKKVKLFGTKTDLGRTLSSGPTFPDMQTMQLLSNLPAEVVSLMNQN